MEDFGTILTLLIAVLAAGAGVVEKMLKKAGKKMPEGNFSLENAAPAEKKETVPAEEVQPNLEWFLTSESSEAPSRFTNESFQCVYFSRSER